MMIKAKKNVRIQSVCRSLAAAVMSILLLTFQGVEAKAAETGATLHIKQEFTVENTSKDVDDLFRYVLIPENTFVPMPKGTAEDGDYYLDIEGSQTVGVGPIEYDHAGIYRYTIRQIESQKAEGYTCDTEVYTVTVTVRNTLNGGLAATVELPLNSAGEKEEMITFDNYFLGNEAPNEGTNPAPKTGDDEGKIEKIFVALLISAIILILLLLIRAVRKHRPGQEKRQERKKNTNMVMKKESRQKQKKKDWSLRLASLLLICCFLAELPHGDVQAENGTNAQADAVAEVKVENVSVQKWVDGVEDGGTSLSGTKDEIITKADESDRSKGITYSDIVVGKVMSSGNNVNIESWKSVAWIGRINGKDYYFLDGDSESTLFTAIEKKSNEKFYIVGTKGAYDVTYEYYYKDENGNETRLSNNPSGSEEETTGNNDVAYYAAVGGMDKAGQGADLKFRIKLKTDDYKAEVTYKVGNGGFNTVNSENTVSGSTEGIYKVDASRIAGDVTVKVVISEKNYYYINEFSPENHGEFDFNDSKAAADEARKLDSSVSELKGNKAKIEVEEGKDAYIVWYSESYDEINGGNYSADYNKHDWQLNFLFINGQNIDLPNNNAIVPDKEKIDRDNVENNPPAKIIPGDSNEESKTTDLTMIARDGSPQTCQVTVTLDDVAYHRKNSNTKPLYNAMRYRRFLIKITNVCDDLDVRWVANDMKDLHDVVILDGMKGITGYCANYGTGTAYDENQVDRNPTPGKRFGYYRIKQSYDYNQIGTLSFNVAPGYNPFKVKISNQWKDTGCFSGLGVEKVGGPYAIGDNMGDGVYSGNLSSNYLAAAVTIDPKELTDDRRGQGQYYQAVNLNVDDSDEGTYNYGVAFDINYGAWLSDRPLKDYGTYDLIQDGPASITMPEEAPTRAGYTFLGWKLSKAANNSKAIYYQPNQVFGIHDSSVLDGNVGNKYLLLTEENDNTKKDNDGLYFRFVAQWAETADTSYTISYYKEDANGNEKIADENGQSKTYSLVKVEEKELKKELRGISGTTVTAYNPNAYCPSGFVLNQKSSTFTITNLDKEDESKNHLKIYYDSNTADLTLTNRITGEFANKNGKVQLTINVKKEDGSVIPAEEMENCIVNDDGTPAQSDLYSYNAETGTITWTASNNAVLILRLPKGSKYTLATPPDADANKWLELGKYTTTYQTNQETSETSVPADKVLTDATSITVTHTRMSVPVTSVVDHPDSQVFLCGACALLLVLFLLLAVAGRLRQER